MRHFMFLVGITVFCSHIACAGPICAAGTLTSYEMLGSGGCMIGTNTVSSFQTLSGITRATPIAASAISITPLGGTTNPGLTMHVNATAAANQILEALFTYKISGNPFTQDMITVSGTSSSGDGVATDVQNYCVGGVFGPDGVTGCTGPASGALVSVGDGTDQAILPSLPLVAVTDDFTLDGGTDGSASGGTFTDQLAATSAVPEPGTFLLAGFGLALAALAKGRGYKPPLTDRRRCES